jgi:anti-sigma regulatory factor (Ser/Thr protein kinase)
MEIVRLIDPVPTAPGQARQSLISLNRTVSPEQLDELRLVVSELVTNSVLHAGLGVGDSIKMSVEVFSDSVRVEVIDRGHGFEEASDRPVDGLGWGLPIVQQLADRWGTERTSETKVWAEFALRPRRRALTAVPMDQPGSARDS